MGRARCLKSHSAAQGASGAIGSGRPQMSRRVAVTLQFHPLHLAGLQANRRVVAGLLPIARAAGVNQGRLSPEHPFTPRSSASARKWASSAKNILAPGPLDLLRQGGLLRYESLPLGLISLEQALLGTLQDKSQAVQVVQTTAAAQLDAEPFRDKLAHHPPIPVGQFDAAYSGNSCTAAFNSACCASPRAGGGGHRTVRISELRATLGEG